LLLSVTLQSEAFPNKIIVHSFQTRGPNNYKISFKYSGKGLKQRKAIYKLTLIPLRED